MEMEEVRKRVSLDVPPGHRDSDEDSSSSDDEDETNSSSSDDSSSSDEEEGNGGEGQGDGKGKEKEPTVRVRKSSDSGLRKRGKSFESRSARRSRRSRDSRRGKSMQLKRDSLHIDTHSIGNSDDALLRKAKSLDLSRPALIDGDPLTTSLFGIRPFLIRPRPSLPEDELELLYRKPSQPPTDVSDASLSSIGNFVWAATFGWVLALVYGIGGMIMLFTIAGKPYASLCWALAGYFFWPFGKYVVKNATHGRHVGVTTYGTMGAESELQPSGNRFLYQSDAWAPPEVACGGIIYCIWCCVAAFIAFFHLIAMCTCWMIVLFIPMAKVNHISMKMIFSSPLYLEVEPEPRGEIILCTNEAAHFRYLHYNAMGLNVVLVNLLFFVAISLVMGYLLPHEYEPPEYVLFTCCILSIIPLAYYIGMAVASIASQTNFAIGAMLNAMFGVSIEIILYGSAILNGGLTELIQAGVVGSLLGDLLLLPGLAMIAGGIKYKEQRFSPAVAGVSSVLLIVSVIGVFTPTIFWLIVGPYNYKCTNCVGTPGETMNTFINFCENCSYQPVNLSEDPTYMQHARPLMYICAAVLPLVYLFGLLFTLKTHSYIFKNLEESEGHTGPNWTKTFSAVVLGCSICLFALISEKAIEAIEPTIHAIGINQLFAGISVMALVPSSAEYVNAIQFALHNNVALSIEIGATSAVQIALIMVPVLVAFSAIVHEGSPDDSLILVFPTFSFFAIIMSVIIVNYLSIEGRANYFKGAVLVSCYVLFITAFYFLSLDRLT